MGHAVPAHSTSSGRALLLDHDADSLAALLGDGPLDAPAPHAPRDVASLASRIAAARADGYAIVDEEFEPGLVGIAAPVRDFRGRIVAALNVSAPKFRLEGRLDAAGDRSDRPRTGSRAASAGTRRRASRPTHDRRCT